MIDLTNMQSKNIAIREEFNKYCDEHPEMRFWQALRAWAETGFILLAEGNAHDGSYTDTQDTYYFKGKYE